MCVCVVLFLVLAKVGVDGGEEVEHAGLDARLHDHNVDVHLLGVGELAHDALVVTLADALGRHAHQTNVLAQRGLEQTLDLGVVVVVVLDAEQRLDVVPDGAAEQARVHVLE